VAQILPGTVSAGGSHCVLLAADGTLRTWGNNSSGQLGDGTTMQRASASQPGSGASYAQVAAGGIHTLALRADGTLWAWGDNYYGQLGTGTTDDASTPTQVGTGTDWKQVAAGYAYSLAVRADGTLWAWGDNSNGQLGDGSAASYSTTPHQVGNATNWLQVTAGDYHTLALRADGTLWAWGNNGYGQLGNGTTDDASEPGQIGTGTNWRSVVAKGVHSLALQTTGTLWAWGNNDFGQLGDGTATSQPVPEQVAPDRLWRQVAANFQNSAAIAADGTLWAWGNNGDGQLGDGTTTASPTPLRVGNATNWVSVSLNNYYNLALQADGSAWAWGYNNDGQLGDGTTIPHSRPARVPGVAGLPTRSVAAGGQHSLGITPAGQLVAWGLNDNGQLGDGTTTARNSPTPIGEAKDWVQVAASGTAHSLALRADGTLWAWGLNTSGQLGTGTTAAQTSPVQIGAGQLWQQVGAGANHSLAVRADGTLWAWGLNADGQLGTGTTATQLSPTQVDPAATWRSVAAGTAHSLAVRADGTLWAWGLNTDGQLGAGTTAAQTSPTQVDTATNWVAATGGTSFSLGLRADGSPWAWGANESGQLGTGTTATTATPPPLAGSNAAWTQLAAGASHGVGRRANGTLWSWGLNTNGQLGESSTVQRLIPTQEATLGTTWLAVSGGGSHSLARTSVGASFFSTGSNIAGQLGDVTTTQSLRYDRNAQPLPVQLVAFAARRTSATTVSLSWTTANELHNAGFGVEKSYDGSTFERVGFVAGKGTSTLAHTYNLVVSESAATYYRLAQADLNGTTTYSPVRWVSGAAGVLALYPNPTAGAATLSGTAASTAVRVLNSLGQLVATATADASGNTPLSLPTGLYLVQAEGQTLRLSVR